MHQRASQRQMGRLRLRAWLVAVSVENPERRGCGGAPRRRCRDRDRMEDRAMRCMSCGRAELGKPELGEVPYLSLPGTTLMDVEVRQCPACYDDEVAIPRIEELDRLLVRVVTAHGGRLTGEEIRYLRRFLGWSGRDFARHFEVDPATVSRWETGAQQMDPRADQLLRMCASRLEPVESVQELETILRRTIEGPTPRPIVARWDEGWIIETRRARARSGRAGAASRAAGRSRRRRGV